MSQHEQNVVGSIDPFPHTSSDQVNTSSTPLRVDSNNLYGSTHHTASPSVGGELFQQSQAPLDSSSAPKTTATTTTTTPITTESTTTQGRKPSLTDTLIAGAATAATTATNAATNAVAAARRLVGNDGSSVIDLDGETPDTVQTEETSSSSQGGILNFMKSSSTNNGLEFSQRTLSSGKHKNHSPYHHVSSATAAETSVPASFNTIVHHDAIQHPMKSVTSNDTISQTTAQDNNTQHPMQQRQNPMQQVMPVNARTAALVPGPTNITFEKPPITRTNNMEPTSTTSTTAAAPTTSILPRRGSIAGQTAVLKEPHNTLYVTRQGGARNQALGVDQPSVSSTSETIKTKTHSGLGVDKPIYVGVHEDSTTQVRRRSSLHVDKTPVFSQNDLNDPNDKEQNSYTGNLVEANSVAGNEKPASPKDPLPLRRRSSFNGLNVDPPTVATSKIAGSGSTDNTNTNRPKGTYNSGYNVDRAGHHDRKTSGFGVDKPAVVTHQMAATTKMQTPSPIFPGSNSTTTTTNSRSHSPTFNKLHNSQNSTIHPYSTTATTSETVINPAEMGPTVTYQNPARFSTSASADTEVIPVEYNGPIPEVKPGEQIIWVKKTIVQTEHYDGAHDNTSGLMPPAPTQDSGTQKRRGSLGSLWDRIRGRRTSAVSMDKGKQRT